MYSIYLTVAVSSTVNDTAVIRDTIIFHEMTAVLCKILQPKYGTDILKGFVISTDRRDHKSPVTSENSEVSAHTVGRQECK
jgi:hypothetical protein